jgi:hypothetical protein
LSPAAQLFETQTAASSRPPSNDHMSKDRTLEVIDPSGLTDADWSEIGKLQRAYAEGGPPALNAGLLDLHNKDVFRHAAVCAAFWPDEMREAIRDQMAEAGIDADDLRELIRKLESPARDQ